MPRLSRLPATVFHMPRTMTTAITLETGRGDLPLALGLGILLLALTLLINAAAYAIGHVARRSVG